MTFQYWVQNVTADYTHKTPSTKHAKNSLYRLCGSNKGCSVIYVVYGIVIVQRQYFYLGEECRRRLVDDSPGL